MQKCVLQYFILFIMHSYLAKEYCQNTPNMNNSLLRWRHVYWRTFSCQSQRAKWSDSGASTSIQDYTQSVELFWEGGGHFVRLQDVQYKTNNKVGMPESRYSILRVGKSSSTLGIKVGLDHLVW